MGDDERAKRRAVQAALEEVEDGMVLGLGSGSTAAYAIRALGEQIDAGMDLVGVPTSHQAAQVARDAGIPIRCLEDVSRIDLALDGADQVADGNLIKGGGGAHAREKLVDTFAKRFAVLVDDSKTAEALTAPVPLEVLPDAVRFVESQVEVLGGTPSVRSATEKLGPAITDNGNFLIDGDFGIISNPKALSRSLADTPGIVEHGLFLDLADVVYIGTEDGVEVYEPV